MAKHQELTGRSAVHPFAFVQATDPALDANNDVGPYKAWIDTSTGNTLKIRNAANTDWLTVFAGASQADLTWRLKANVETNVNEFPNPISINDPWVERTIS